MNTHNMRLIDNQLQKMKNGTKTIELRLNDNKRKNIIKGDLIHFKSTTTSEEIIMEVLERFDYSNFHELYKDFDKISLGYDPADNENPEDMYKFYSEDLVSKYGVVGFKIKYKGNQD